MNQLKNLLHPPVDRRAERAKIEWAALCADIQREISSVNSSLYRVPAERFPEIAPLEKYLKTLRAYAAILRGFRTLERSRTPSQWVEEFNRTPGAKWPPRSINGSVQLHSPIDNNGFIWPDWIPRTVKQDLKKEWNSIPALKKRKKREFFPEKQPPRGAKRKRQLVESAIKAKEVMEFQHQQLASTGHTQYQTKIDWFEKQISLTNIAIERLLEHPAGRKLPAHWKQILTADERRVFGEAP